MPNRELDFKVDKLTRSIENVLTGDSFATEISLITQTDQRIISQKSGWLFNWKYEVRQPERDVYKLTIVNNPRVIQGLISLEVKADHVFMHLVESASFNKGRSKVYAECPVTWWLLPVNFLFSGVMREMCPLFQNLS
ncbi:MAG: hypothetical protein AAB221_15310 [Bacteroidota bacterium]